MPERTILGTGRRAAVESGAGLEIEDLRCFVTISRTHPSDCGDRQIYVTLDDKRTRLVYGEEFTDELRPGTHRLRAHNTLMWKNIRFTLEPGEHLEFALINAASWWTWGCAGVLGAAPLFLKVQKRVRQ